MRSTINARNSMIGVDCSGAERRAFLKKMQHTPLFSKCGASPSKSMCQIECDVSNSDRRSVKAYLDGRWSWRVRWWNFNRSVHQLIQPNASLEKIMFSFHKRHHALTIGWIELHLEVRETYRLLDHNGAYRGMQLLFKREKDRLRGEKCQDGRGV